MFDSSPDAVNRNLQLLHFRRAGLALIAAQAELTPDSPLRLALRRLAPLQEALFAGRPAGRARAGARRSWPTAPADLKNPGTGVVFLG